MITVEDFKAGKEANIIELSVLARELGIDVDAIIKKHMEAEYLELHAAIRDALAKRGVGV